MDFWIDSESKWRNQQGNRNLDRSGMLFVGVWWDGKGSEKKWWERKENSRMRKAIAEREKMNCDVAMKFGVTFIELVCNVPELNRPVSWRSLERVMSRCLLFWYFETWIVLYILLFLIKWAYFLWLKMGVLFVVAIARKSVLFQSRTCVLIFYICGFSVDIWIV